MNKLPKALATEWEKNLFRLAFAAFSLLLLVRLHGVLSPAVSARTDGRTVRSDAPVLGPRALAFMDRTTAAQTGMGNPFLYETTVDLPAPPAGPETVTPVTPPPNRVDAPPPPVTVAAGSPDPTPVPVVAPPVAPRIRQIEYKGMMESVTGVLLASVTVRDPATGAGAGGLRQAGQVVFEDHRVVEFREDRLVLESPGGIRSEFSRGVPGNVVLE